jgi:hypothetical protein
MDKRQVIRNNGRKIIGELPCHVHRQQVEPVVIQNAMGVDENGYVGGGNMIATSGRERDEDLSAGTLRPQAAMTHAEAAVVLYRLLAAAELAIRSNPDEKGKGCSPKKLEGNNPFFL